MTTQSGTGCRLWASMTVPMMWLLPSATAPLWVGAWCEGCWAYCCDDCVCCLRAGLEVPVSEAGAGRVGAGRRAGQRQL
ncbi:hypothetical protein ACLESD_41095, partial [Pyxidicoccus sp. 3LFB2]